MKFGFESFVLDFQVSDFFDVTGESVVQGFKVFFFIDSSGYEVRSEVDKRD